MPSPQVATQRLAGTVLAPPAAVGIGSVAAMCNSITALSAAHSLTWAKRGPARAAGRLRELVIARVPLCHPMRTTWPPVGHTCGPRPVAGAILQLET